APTMFFYLMAGPLAFAPDTVAAARLVPALLGTATLATTYLLARVLCGRLVALAALGFLATFDLHLFFSRLASHNVADGLFVSATLACLYLALTRGRLGDYAAAGVLLGLGQYAYAGARALLLIVPIVLAREALATPEWRRRAGPGLAALALGAILAMA